MQSIRLIIIRCCFTLLQMEELIFVNLSRIWQQYLYEIIELRQIGVRDETKIRGGIGICGRPLCCSTYLSEFAAVSIKMAKEQNLSLNPSKISGVCGRLMCCLTNEEETYEELNSQLPSVGGYRYDTGGVDRKCTFPKCSSEVGEGYCQFGK